MGAFAAEQAGFEEALEDDVFEGVVGAELAFFGLVAIPARCDMGSETLALRMGYCAWARM